MWKRCIRWSSDWCYSQYLPEWVTDQINDDHIDAEENRFEESAIYALFITNEPNQLQWVTNQINDDHNDAEENTLEESATYALFITNEPIHVQ